MSALTSESEQPAEPGRKFDDIASLFGSIVPVPGTPTHPLRPFKPLSIPRPGATPAAAIPTSPPSSPPPPPPPSPTSPSELPEALGEIAPEPEATVSFQDFASEPAAAPSPDTPIAIRTRPQEIPWPDAFEPRPNYRKPEPRNWTWLLLIPVGLVAAFGISVIDTRSLKGWIDTNLLHRTPIAATPSDSLLPVPFRTTTNTNTRAATTAAPTEAPELTPALPTSPVPVPPGTEVSPPPANSAEAVVPPPIHVTIQYRRGVPGADGEARRMAALLQNTGGSVELHPNATTLKSPTIMFYNPVDKNSAAGLAVTLANEAATWTVRQGTTTPTSHTPPGSIDIWMP